MPQISQPNGHPCSPPAWTAKSKRVCFFAHFDRDGLVAPHVIHYLESLVRHEFAIVFVTSSQLGEIHRQALAGICVDVIERENAGLDFGSWGEAYRRFGRFIKGDLLLANDSVFGPIGQLSHAFAAFDIDDADFFGMVESHEIGPHLQSWFVLLRPRAHQSQEFQDVISQDFGSLSKRAIIEQGELGLTAALASAGLRWYALYSPSRSGLLAARVPMNPTHFLWRPLVEHFGVPFIKVELLRDNPAGMCDIDQWQGVVSLSTPELEPQIVDHLRRVGVAKSSRSTFLRPHRQSFYLRDMRFCARGWVVAAWLNLRVFSAASSSISTWLHLRRFLGRRLRPLIRRRRAGIR